MSNRTLISMQVEATRAGHRHANHAGRRCCMAREANNRPSVVPVSTDAFSVSPF